MSDHNRTRPGCNVCPRPRRLHRPDEHDPVKRVARRLAYLEEYVDLVMTMVDALRGVKSPDGHCHDVATDFDDDFELWEEEVEDE